MNSKSTNDSLLNVSLNHSRTLPTNLQLSSGPLFELDLASQNLKGYLDKIAITLNQHAVLINTIKQDTHKRISQRQISDFFKLIGDHCQLYDTQFQKNMILSVGKSLRQQNGPHFLENKLNQLCNRMNVMSNGITFVYQNTKDYETRIKDMENQINEFVRFEHFQDQHQKMKNELEEQIKEIQNNSEKSVSQLDRKYQLAIDAMKDQVGQFQRKTLWKIQDTETIMLTRITQDYVDDSYKSLEEQLLRTFQNSQDFNQLQNTYLQLSIKISGIQSTHGDQIKNLRSAINSLEDKHEQQALKQEKFQEFKSQNSGQLVDVLKRLRDLESRTDISTLFERFNFRFQNIEEESQNIRDDLAQQYAELYLRSGSSSASFSNSDGGSSDYHRLCSLESSLSKCLSDVKKLTLTTQKLERESKQKMDRLDCALFDSLHSSTKAGLQENEEITRFQMKIENQVQNINARLQKQFGVRDNQSAKKLVEDIRDINRRMEAMTQLEKRISRFLKELDPNQLSQQLKAKVDHDDVLQDFAIADAQINSNSEMINILRREIDNLMLFFRKFNLSQNNSLSTNTSQYEDSPFLTSQQIHPISNNNSSIAFTTVSKHHCQNSIQARSHSHSNLNQYHSQKTDNFDVTQQGPKEVELSQSNYISASHQNTVTNLPKKQNFISVELKSGLTQSNNQNQDQGQNLEQQIILQRPGSAFK